MHNAECKNGGRKWGKGFQNGRRWLHLMSRSRDSVITEETAGEKVMIPVRKRVESLQGNGPKGRKPTGKSQRYRFSFRLPES